MAQYTMKQMVFVGLILLMASAHVFGQPSGSKQDIAELAAKYGNSQNESQRLLISVEAIDKGLICKGCPLETVNAIFGTGYSTKDMSRRADDGLFTVIVPLRTSPAVLREKPVASVRPEDSEKTPPSATAVSGWRLGITYDNYGKIRMYYLSNAVLAPIGF